MAGFRKVPEPMQEDRASSSTLIFHEIGGSARYLVTLRCSIYEIGDPKFIGRRCDAVPACNRSRKWGLYSSKAALAAPHQSKSNINVAENLGPITSN